MSERTEELKKFILNKMNDLLTDIGALRRYAEELETEIDDLNFEIARLKEIIAEQEDRLHQEYCEEIAKDM